MHVYLYVCYYLVFIYLIPRRPAPCHHSTHSPALRRCGPAPSPYTHAPPPHPCTGPPRKINLRIFRLWWRQRERGSVTL